MPYGVVGCCEVDKHSSGLLFSQNVILDILGQKGEVITKTRFESRLGVEYELREDGIQSQGLSWLQASEGSSKLFRSKGFRDLVTLSCRNLPQVLQFLVDESGGIAVHGFVSPVLHKL